MRNRRQYAAKKNLAFQKFIIILMAPVFAGVFCGEPKENPAGQTVSREHSLENSSSEVSNSEILKAPKVFRFALKAPLQSEDPVESVDVTSGMILSMIHRTLFRTNPAGEVVPDLIERVNFKGTKAELILKKGVKFQDGSTLSADDVYYCLKRLKDSGRQQWVSENLKTIYRPQKKDRLFIELTVAPGVDARQIWQRQKTLFTLTQNSIYSARVHQKEGRFLGASMLSLARSDLREIVLQAQKPGSFEKELLFEVRYQVISDDSARWFAFKHGLLDYYEARGLYRFLGYDEKSYKLLSRQALIVLYGAIVAPEDHPESILHNRTFRRALNFRLDRVNFAEKVFSGNYSPADYPVPDLLGQGVILKPLYDFDPDWGKDELKKLSANPAALNEEITIFALSDRERGLFSRGLVDIITKMGFQAHTKVVDLATMISLNNRRIPGIYLFMWQADYPHAENFLIPLFHSKNRGGGGNRAFYSNPALDQILDTKPLEGETLRRVQEMIRRDAPWVFLGFSREYIFIRRDSKVKAPVLYTGWGPEAFGQGDE